jgi:hypothetical protein
LAQERRRASGGTPPHPADGYRLAVNVLLGFSVLLSLTTAACQVLLGSASVGGDEGFLRGLVGEDYAFSLSMIQVVVGAGLLAVWVLWFSQVRAVAERLAPGRLRYRPAMAGQGWFIPVWNLFVPKRIADDIWHASSPPSSGGRMAPPALSHSWWALWLLTFLTWPVLFWPWSEFTSWEFGRGYDGVEPIVWANLGAQLLVVPVAIAAFLFVRRLTAMQAARLDG